MDGKTRKVKRGVSRFYKKVEAQEDKSVSSDASRKDFWKDYNLVSDPLADAKIRGKKAGKGAKGFSDEPKSVKALRAQIEALEKKIK